MAPATSGATRLGDLSGPADIRPLSPSKPDRRLARREAKTASFRLGAIGQYFMFSARKTKGAPPPRQQSVAPQIDRSTTESSMDDSSPRRRGDVALCCAYVLARAQGVGTSIYTKSGPRAQRSGSSISQEVRAAPTKRRRLAIKRGREFRRGLAVLQGRAVPGLLGLRVAGAARPAQEQ